MVDFPKISCIVPVFNGARFLREAIASIRGQTYPSIEVIVVDDGSTDETPELLRSLDVSHVRQGNAGPASARNRGVRMSSGHYLAFLDADDVWHPEKLERQMSRFAARPELSLCLAHQQPFWVDEMKHEEQRLRETDHPFARVHPGYVCQAMLMPRSTFDEVGPFDESLRIGEDTEWLMRAERAGVVREVLSDVLVYRRMHQNNLSYTRYDGGAADQLKLVFDHIRRRRAAAGSSNS